MLVLILLLVVVGIICWLAQKYNWGGINETKNGVEYKPENDNPAGCCGEHTVCPTSSLYATDSNIVYYNDEELDELAFKDPDTFDDETIEEIEDVIDTLKQDEIAGWLRSLQQRHIKLPTELMDEALMIVQELRSSYNN